MFKRTAAHILLLLLIITGLGSRVSNKTLDAKERRLLVKNLKDTKAIFLESIEGLTEAQLAYKVSPDKPSVNECIYNLVLKEKQLWGQAEKALNQPGQSEGQWKSNLTDSQVITAANRYITNPQILRISQLQKAGLTDNTDAVTYFKEHRAALIKYVKTTTEDVRNHTIKSELGTLDVYQLLLLIPENTTVYTQQIEAIKSAPRYPKSVSLFTKLINL